MVKLKYILREDVLVLRISEAKTRYYKRVSHLLIGKPNIKKHWNPDKERFTKYAIEYAANNKALEEYKKIYTMLLFEHPELTAKQVADYYKSETPKKESEQTVDEELGDVSNSIPAFMKQVIAREKAKQGCNFEVYDKLYKKCEKILPGFKGMAFSTLDYNKMVGIAYIFAKHKGYRNTAKSFRAFLGRASKDNSVNFRLTQIGDFCFSDYNPNKYDVVERHPDILTQEQLRAFMNMSVYDITPSYKDHFQVGVYYDFCVFMFHSFFAPCDVIKAKLKDITNRGTIMVKRKKTHRQVEVPITPAMRSIIDRYKNKSRDGYIFPIMDDSKDKQYATKDYIFKRFREKLNIWLKEVGKELGVNYDLYAYVFRHTAITTAINSGLPVSYVANAAGTSVDIIQEHYYNGECAQNRNMLTAAFMSACV